MFKNSIQIGTLWGIPLKLHYSFLIVLPFLAWAFGNNIRVLAEMADVPITSLGANPYILGLFMSLALFTSVALHELAHSVVARQKGVHIHSINLMLFGGVAQMEELPENPRDEAMIAFAGPLLSLVLGGFLLGTMYFLGRGIVPDIQLLFVYLGWLNIFLAVFNLLPAFPTDGGRVLRALLARRIPFVKATRIAANIGKAFAFGLGLLGFLSFNFILVFIAFFIYIGASQEYQTIFIKYTLEGFSVSDLMTRDVQVVFEDTTLAQLMDRMFNERHSGYPVVDREGRLTGCVTMEDIQKVEPKDHLTTRVRDIMSMEIKRVRPDEEIYRALRIMSKEDVGRLMVMDGEELVGIITRSDIMKGFRLRQMISD